MVEATVRLDVLSPRSAGLAAWGSALAVTDTASAFAEGGRELRRREVARFLTVEACHPGSIVRCVDMARTNARAVRTALTREAWSAINRAWLHFEAKPAADDPTAVLGLVEAVKNETRGFEGPVHRMLRNQTTWFIRLGQAVERADNTARLLDVKYHILLPAGERIGGVVDRDQWTTILQTVSAVTAYRWLYSDGLKPANVIDLLIARTELPRSPGGVGRGNGGRAGAACPANGAAWGGGSHGEVAANRMTKTRSGDVIAGGLHHILEAFIQENALLHGAIGRQFKFA